MISFNIVNYLSQLIRIQSFSKEEDLVAQYVQSILENDFFIPTNRYLNNVYAVNKHFTQGKFTILLNSHIDTVKPNPAYTNNPFAPIQQDGKLFGLGSNDAGGALMGLMGAFIHFYNQENLPFNLVFAASAEEEISGKNGMEALFPILPKIDFAIVGEPTLGQIAVAERGLMVLDVVATGVAGHAARKEGVNAIYKALQDIQWFQTYQFPKVSDELSEVGMMVTQINAGSQHNVVPAECNFVVDIRVNDCYSNTEVLEIVQQNIQSTAVARSTRLNSSGVSAQHPIREVAKIMNLKTYGSPTLSDQALMPCESVKIGPGDSARSHTANEFIFLDELQNAVPHYNQILNELGKLL